MIMMYNVRPRKFLVRRTSALQLSGARAWLTRFACGFSYTGCLALDTCVELDGTDWCGSAICTLLDMLVESE